MTPRSFAIEMDQLQSAPEAIANHLLGHETLMVIQSVEAPWDTGSVRDCEGRINEGILCRS